MSCANTFLFFASILAFVDKLIRIMKAAEVVKRAPEQLEARPSVTSRREYSIFDITPAERFLFRLLEVADARRQARLEHGRLIEGLTQSYDDEVAAYMVDHTTLSRPEARTLVALHELHVTRMREEFGEEKFDYGF